MRHEPSLRERIEATEIIGREARELRHRIFAAAVGQLIADHPHGHVGKRFLAVVSAVDVMATVAADAMIQSEVTGGAYDGLQSLYGFTVSDDGEYATLHANFSGAEIIVEAPEDPSAEPVNG